MRKKLEKKIKQTKFGNRVKFSVTMPDVTFRKLHKLAEQLNTSKAQVLIELIDNQKLR